MGLTERHWFEYEEPELTERQLEDIVYEKDKAYQSGYIKGYHDRDMKIIRCKDCYNKECWGRTGNVVCGIDGNSHRPDWFCSYGVLR